MVILIVGRLLAADRSMIEHKDQFHQIHAGERFRDKMRRFLDLLGRAPPVLGTNSEPDDGGGEGRDVGLRSMLEFDCWDVESEDWDEDDEVQGSDSD
ncbi:hypothetical protein NQ176_g2372 [Zarea fungicola]|uniref:Uncharacterized protein n=1 Tax=Zarea fungicola TaxID=93591 RepID=A0ACC1NNP7_9HYPO|nr:hypothetical protein NQ176_g2372 [Lecanicillium fungicola]